MKLSELKFRDEGVWARSSQLIRFGDKRIVRVFKARRDMRLSYGDIREGEFAVVDQRTPHDDESKVIYYAIDHVELAVLIHDAVPCEEERTL